MDRRPGADHVAQNVGVAQATIYSAGARQNGERRRLKSGGRTAPVLSTSPPARILKTPPAKAA